MYSVQQVCVPLGQNFFILAAVCQHLAIELANIELHLRLLLCCHIALLLCVLQSRDRIIVRRALASQVYFRLPKNLKSSAHFRLPIFRVILNDSFSMDLTARFAANLPGR